MILTLSGADVRAQSVGIYSYTYWGLYRFLFLLIFVRSWSNGLKKRCVEPRLGCGHGLLLARYGVRVAGCHHGRGHCEHLEKT